MGEARRRMETGSVPHQGVSGGVQNITIDLAKTNAKKQACECGSELFTAAITLYRVSALMSPIGQEMLAQQPVLVCLECKKPWTVEGKTQ